MKSIALFSLLFGATLVLAKDVIFEQAASVSARACSEATFAYLILSVSGLK